jgi:hypothetical protein
MRASIGDEIDRRIGEMRQNIRGKGRSGSSWSPGFAPKRNIVRPDLQHDLRARVILAILVEHPHLIGDFYEQIGLLQFSDEKMEKLRQTVISIISDVADLDVDGFRHHLSEYGFKNIRGLSLLKGMESKIRFDPESLDGDEARKRLTEVIMLENTGTRRSNKKPDLQRFR